MRCAALLLATLCGMAHAAPGLWERLPDSDQVTAVSGNGGLTAGVDAYGRLCSLRWPSPGYHDQLESRTTVAMRGAFWSLAVAHAVYPINETPWGESQRYEHDRSTLIVTEGESDAGMRVTQSLVVHKDRDVLAAKIRVTGTAVAPRIFWNQNLAPSTRKLVGAPIADWVLDANNDFALYLDPRDRTFYHFRPKRVDRAAWERARYLATKPDAPWAWRVFEDGVWSATGSDQPLSAYDCIQNEAGDGTLPQLKGRGSAVAPCRLVAELVPVPRDGGYEAVVFLAFGSSYTAASEALDMAREQGFDTLRVATEKRWRAWLSGIQLTLENNPDESIRRRALLTLAQSTDRNTGAVVGSPVTVPPLALVSPRTAAWASLLYDTAGLANAAGAALIFFADKPRVAANGTAPEGSLPLALYTDGTLAAPEGVVDVNGAGWWISACLRHAKRLDAPSREEFLSVVWPGVSAVADFLARWVLVPTGEPFPAYQPDLLRDGQSVGTLFMARLGLESALDLAETQGLPAPPSWADTLAEYEARIRFRAINQGDAPDEAWPMDRSLPLWLQSALPSQDRIWNARLQWDGTSPTLREASRFETVAAQGKSAGRATTVEAALAYLAATVRIYGQ